MSVDLPFSMVIRWSDEDRLYIAHLPEFGEGALTHGATYEEAARNGKEVLELLVESFIADGNPLPKPEKFVSPPFPRRRAAKKPITKRKKHLQKQA